MTNSSFSQDDHQKMIVFHAGIAVPYSHFAQNTFSYNAGFARSGVNMEIDFLYYLGKYFGTGITAGYTRFGFDKEAYRTAYNEALMQDEDIDITAGNYQVAKSTLHFIMKYPLFDQTEVMISGQIGYALSVHPGLRAVDARLGEINTVQRDVGGRHFTGTSIRIHQPVSKKIGIALSYNRYYTKPSFDDATGEEDHFYLPISYQNINLGLIVLL